jgi:hypothetical protein
LGYGFAAAAAGAAQEFLAKSIGFRILRAASHHAVLFAISPAGWPGFSLRPSPAYRNAGRRGTERAQRLRIYDAPELTNGEEQ